MMRSPRCCSDQVSPRFLDTILPPVDDLMGAGPWWIPVLALKYSLTTSSTKTEDFKKYPWSFGFFSALKMQLKIQLLGKHHKRNHTSRCCWIQKSSNLSFFTLLFWTSQIPAVLVEKISVISGFVPKSSYLWYLVTHSIHPQALTTSGPHFEVVALRWCPHGVFGPCWLRGGVGGR